MSSKAATPSTTPMLPMFPLGSVLLPGSALPLHVFESRYRAMVRDCLAQDGEPEFGQVLITHGSEAGGGDERAMAGTRARMLQVEVLDDGRYVLVAVGVERIRITRWHPDDPYPIADVVDWPDDWNDDVPGDAVDASSIRGRLDASARRVRDLIDLAARLGDAPSELGAGAVAERLADDPTLASYQLASMAPIGPADRFRLLTATGPTQRLDLLDTVIDDVEAMMKFRLS